MCIFCILKLQLWTVMANPSRLSSLLLTSWMNLGQLMCYVKMDVECKFLCHSQPIYKNYISLIAKNAKSLGSVSFWAMQLSCFLTMQIPCRFTPANHLKIPAWATEMICGETLGKIRAYDNRYGRYLWCDGNVLELVMMVRQHGKYTKNIEMYTLKW